MNEVANNATMSRYELAIPGSDEPAVAYYRDEDGYRILTHTLVPYKYSGEGIGSKLAKGVFDDARAHGYRLVLQCQFMGHWFAEHPQYSDVVAG